MYELDAYGYAKLLLNRHGRDAPIHAAMRLEDLDFAGDEAGFRIWLAILDAIDELSRVVATAGKLSHPRGLKTEPRG